MTGWSIALQPRAFVQRFVGKVLRKHDLSDRPLLNFNTLREKTASFLNLLSGSSAGETREGEQAVIHQRPARSGLMCRPAAVKSILPFFFAMLLAVAPVRADDSNRAKARALVNAAIQMTDSNQALKLLWQATDIDPTFNEAYIYLGLYYNSREDYGKVIEVYKKLVKYQPNETSAYINIGEAYFGFSPPKYDEALQYYRKAYEVDPHSSFAALRIGQILAQQGNREEATRFLKQASADSAKNADVASQAKKMLAQLGVF